jgi:lipopolysaccharide transport system permease protein
LETLTSSAGVIVANGNYVKKVVFPLEILPIAVVGSSLFHCLVSLGLVVIAVAGFGTGLSWTFLWLPILVLPILFLSAGVAWLLSALGVFLRDLTFVTQFLSLLFMFLSAVFFPASKIPARFSFLTANPLLIALESSRNAVLWHTSPSWSSVFYLYWTGLVICMGGYLVFNKLKPAFADVV